MPHVNKTHGMFTWTDLSAPDPEGAKAFYTALFGWEATDMPAGEMGTYTMLKKDGQDVAGLGSQPPELKGAPAVWTSYVTVEDVDEVTGRVAELGGQVLMPPMDVMSAGRMSMAQDPAGAVFALWEARDHDGAGTYNEHGAMTWNELNTRDLGAARPFYEQLLGWSVNQDDMGGGMVYNLITIGGDHPNGGMLQMDDSWPEGIPPHWMVYFAVDDVDATAGDATELGGTLVVPPTDIPVGRFAVISDPQGGTFTIFKPNPTDA